MTIQPLARIVLLGVVLFACAGEPLTASAAAQSGRRIPKKPSPPPVATSEPEPPPKPAEPEKPRTPMLLVEGGSPVTSDMILNRVAIRSCEARLKDSSLLAVRTGKDMNRGEASDYAKSMNQYVVSLDLEQEMSRAARFDDIWVRYVVFTPGTGKVKRDGRVYLRAPRAGVGVPLPAPRSRAALEYAVEEAGREAAERILDALGLASPPRRHLSATSLE